MELGEEWVNFSVLLHCAVYALMRRGEVVYIGKSKSLCARLYEHYRTRGKNPAKKSYYGTSIYKGMMFDEVWVRPCMLGELDRLEIEAIRKYQPKYNVRGKLKVPAEVSMEDLLTNLVPMLPAALERRGWRGF